MSDSASPLENLAKTSVICGRQSVQRASLVDDQRIDVTSFFHRSALREKNTVQRALAPCDGEGDRRGRPSAHGQAMMSTATAFTNA